MIDIQRVFKDALKKKRIFSKDFRIERIWLRMPSQKGSIEKDIPNGIYPMNRIILVKDRLVIKCFFWKKIDDAYFKKICECTKEIYFKEGNFKIHGFRTRFPQGMIEFHYNVNFSETFKNSLIPGLEE